MRSAQDEFRRSMATLNYSNNLGLMIIGINQPIIPSPCCRPRSFILKLAIAMDNKVNFA